MPWTTRGVAMWSPSWNTATAASPPFPAQVQDCKTAVRFMRKHADIYRVDSDNIFLLGDSSGGHTVLLAGTTSGQ